MFKHLCSTFLMLVGLTAHAESRLIIKFKPNYSVMLSAQAIKQEMVKPYSAAQMTRISTQAQTNLQYSHAVGQLGVHVLRLPVGSTARDLENVMTRLKTLPDVLYVEEDAWLYPQAIPNDSSYSSLWAMQPPRVGSYGTDFETAWNTSNGNGVVVAVLDTGLLPHPDIGSMTLDSNLVSGNIISAGYDFISDCRVAATCPASTSDVNAGRDPVANAFDQGDWIAVEDLSNPFFSAARCSIKNSSWHGTHVAGIIAAQGNNNLGVIGGAYGAKILPVRVLGKCGGFLSDIANGTLWAAGVHGMIPNPNPAQIINLSLGGSGTCNATAQIAIDAATAAGAVVVVAAGNASQNISNTQPANCNHVIAVAASSKNGDRATYSNFGSLVSLTAPGGHMLFANDPNGILSTYNDGVTSYDGNGFSYRNLQGTSMAAPHVAAAAALVKVVKPAYTPDQVSGLLQAYATPFPLASTCSNAICGAGILNVGSILTDTPNLTAAPTTVNFGSHDPAVTADQVVTFTNNGLASALLATASVSNPSHFAIVGDSCSGQNLAINSSCTLTVRFIAPANGLAYGVLIVPATIAGASANNAVPLAGASARKLVVLADSVSFPDTTVNLSVTLPVSFTNTSGSAVVTGMASVTGSTIAIQADQCSGILLANGQSCSVTLIATPTTVGNYSGSLSLNTIGTGDVATTISLSGTASAPIPPSGGSSGGGGGGGGSIAWWTLLGMALLAALVRYQVKRYADS